MAETKVIMPQMGESIFEGTITKWLKKKGDRIQRDEPLFEISTDKIDSEIPSPASGILQDVLVKEGQTVQINTVVAVIGDGAAKQEAPAKEAPPKQEQKQEPKEVKGPAPVAGPTEETKKDETEEEAEDIRSSPLVRK
jgi:2-oxoglutarate dehydrogenase E2 component (dihydrolipoamide succinyltransferase)